MCIRDREAPAPQVRASAPKVFRSPEEILNQITPEGAFIGLSSNEHRWTSRFPSSDKKLQGTEYSKATMSASFALIRPWKEALQMVHQFNWNKFMLLNPGSPHQNPGEIPEHIYEGLEAVINSLPPVKRYTKDT